MTINTQRFEGKFTDSAGATWLISIGYERAEGRAIPVDFTIRGRDGVQLTQRALREVPFSKMALVSRGAPAAERRELALKAGEFRRYNQERAYRGSARLTSEEIELTIRVFMDAFATGRPTIKTVAMRFGISESAANKRIIMLRKMELLPASRRSRRRGKSRH